MPVAFMRLVYMYVALVFISGLHSTYNNDLSKLLNIDFCFINLKAKELDN